MVLNISISAIPVATISYYCYGHLCSCLSRLAVNLNKILDFWIHLISITLDKILEKAAVNVVWLILSESSKVDRVLICAQYSSKVTFFNWIHSVSGLSLPKLINYMLNVFFVYLNILRRQHGKSARVNLQNLR